jgi:hypothetical protein
LREHIFAVVDYPGKAQETNFEHHVVWGSPYFPGRQTLIIMTRTDTILFRFLERYIGQLEGPVANQIWNRFMQLVKEVVTGLKDLKLQGYYTLRCVCGLRFALVRDSHNSRCLTVLADKIVQTAAVDDKRLRKELQVRLVFVAGNTYWPKPECGGKLR